MSVAAERMMQDAQRDRGPTRQQILANIERLEQPAVEEAPVQRTLDQVLARMRVYADLSLTNGQVEAALAALEGEAV